MKAGLDKKFLEALADNGLVNTLKHLSYWSLHSNLLLMSVNIHATWSQ